MTTHPVPDFLSLDGTPDPRRPTPAAPESQLPPITHIPGTYGTPEDVMTLPVHPQIPGSCGPSRHLDSIQTIAPETGELLSSMKSGDYADVAQPQTGVPGPLPQGYVKTLPQNMGDQKIQDAIRTLAEANIPVAMPGSMEATPYMEVDEDWLNLDETNKTFLRVLEKTGRATRAAEIAGLSRSCFTMRKKRDPVFAKLWKKALSQRAEMIEDEAIRRAVQGVNKNIYYMGAVCGQEKVYSDALLNKLLEGNMPEKYRQNHKIELEGKMAVATLVLPAITSAEEWAAQNSGTVIEQAPEDEYK